DTFEIRARTVVEDSVITYSSSTGSQILEHTFGKLDDPQFGSTSSEVVTQMFLSEFGSEFLEFDIDSVIMTFVYDSLGSYGNLDEPISVEAIRNGTTMESTENYYSNDIFTKNLVPMGKKLDFIPNFDDSIRVDRPGDTTMLAPHLRIRMSDNFIKDLQRQTPGTYEIDDSFSMWFKGVHLVLSEGENTMIGIDLNHPTSGMTIYYSAPDSSLFKSYQFIFTGRFGVHVQVATFKHNYNGSVVDAYLDDWDRGDSLVFTQSFSGVNTEFEVIGLEDFEDVLINQALLEFYVADLADNDLDLYPETKRIQTRTINDDGRLVNSRDVNFAFGIQELSFYGGDLITDDDGNKLYRMNVTASVQDIVQKRAGNRIFLSSLLKQNDPRRVILYGPGHPDFPARLRIIYTETR
ncbi:MAG: hypothetical protein DRI69_02935, partial [Bacteroidetes bacterium]